MSEPKELGPCPLCGRMMFEGPSVNRHHLMPKAFGGREAHDIHKICHTKIHSLFADRELVRHFHTWERLQAHEEMQSFIKWVRKKHPEFYSRNRTAHRKRRR